MEILVASTNSFKVNALKIAWELDGLNKFAPVITFDDLQTDNDFKIEENTGTIEGDALKKATGYSQHYNRPVVAMDQGFSFDALNGWPGTSTKKVLAGSEDRVLGNFNDDVKEQLNDADRAKLVLSKLKDENRAMTCFYAVSVAIPGQPAVVGVHEVHGIAAKEAIVENGWFYDWFFIPDGYNVPFSSFKKEDFEKFAREKMYRIPEEIISFVREL